MSKASIAVVQQSGLGSIPVNKADAWHFHEIFAKVFTVTSVTRTQLFSTNFDNVLHRLTRATRPTSLMFGIAERFIARSDGPEYPLAKATRKPSVICTQEDTTMVEILPQDFEAKI